MRNLKRALSLALAAVMVIGMMVVGAGAASFNDFTDKDEIKNADAVSMVTELGIINGLPNGTFGPTQNIDRASFVKMLCLTYNGGNEPLLPSGAKVSYVDTAGTWASQYIEYCTNLNFVAGDGTTGKFNPTSPVTVSQAAKMLLVALGYEPKTQGYVGYDWQMNVDTAANTSGLYKGLTNKDTSGNLTRDDAAQMIYNALNGDMVKYDGVYNAATGTINPQLAKTGKTMLEEKFGAVKVDAVVVGNEYAAISGAVQDSGKTNMLFEDVKDGDKVILADGIFKVASSMDMIGKTVTMYVKPGNTNDASKATVLGALIVSTDNKVATLTAGKDTLKKINSWLDDENLEIGTGKETKYYVNYEIQMTGTDKDEYARPEKNVAGQTMTFIDNDGDGTVEYILVLAKTFGQVDSYLTTGKGTIHVSPIESYTTGVGTVNSTNAAKEIKGFEDVEKDQYVLYYTLNGKNTFVEPAEYVDVTVSSIKGDKVTAGGTTYEQSGLVKFVNADQDATLGSAVTLGDEIRLYLDTAGYVVYTDAVNSTTDYLYVSASDKYNDFRDTVEVKAVFADGTTSTIDVKAKNLATDGQEVAPGIYTYSKNSKNVYTLTKADNTAIPTGITKGDAILTSNVIANGNTIFVVDRGSSYSVYTGINNVPTLKAPTTGDDQTFKAVACVKDKVAKIVFVTNANLSGNAEGIYVLSKNPTVTGSKDDPTYTYDVVYKGEKTELTGDKGLFPSAGYYAEVEVNGKEIASVTTSSLMAAAPATESGKYVVSTAAKTYTYTDKTIFLVVDGTDVTEVSASAVVIDKFNSDNTDNIVIVATDSTHPTIADYVFICK